MISGWIKVFFSLLIAIFYFCCKPSISSTDFYNKTSITKQEMTICTSALEKIKNRDFVDWTGLPANCDWSSLVGDLPSIWDEVPERYLGSSFLAGKILMADLEGYMRASFSFREGDAVLFEAKGPELQTPVSDLIENLGVPETKLDWNFGTLPCLKSEYVYPSKGITLFLSTDKTRVFHIALYPSSTLDNYLEKLRPKLGKTRLPRH